MSGFWSKIKTAGIFSTASKTPYGSELEFPKGSSSNTSDTSSFEKFASKTPYGSEPKFPIESSDNASDTSSFKMLETLKSRSRARDFFLGGDDDLTECSYVEDSTDSSSSGTVKLSARDLLKDLLHDYSSFKEETALSKRKHFVPEWEYRTHRQNYLRDVIERELARGSKHIIKLVVDLSDIEFELRSLHLQPQELSDVHEIYYAIPPIRECILESSTRISLIATQTSTTSSVSHGAILAFTETLLNLYQLSDDLESDVHVDMSGCTVGTQVLLLPEILSAKYFHFRSVGNIVSFFTKQPFRLNEVDALSLLEIKKSLVNVTKSSSLVLVFYFKTRFIDKYKMYQKGDKV